MSDDRNEALRLADALEDEGVSMIALDGLSLKAAALLRQQAERIAELEGELKATSDKLQDLQSTFDYVRERRAQISHRLWVWAHEELSEPLKTRYFNIVANGTADVMEQPTYAQQYNAQKYRADAATAERDQLRAEVERLRPNAERYEWLRDNLESEWAICEWQDDPDGLGYYRDARASHIVDAAIDLARTHKETP